jgi:hypothetical protein
LLVALALALQFQILGGIQEVAMAYTMNSTNIGITVTPFISGVTIFPPEDFTVVDLGAGNIGNDIQFNWTAGLGSIYTMIRGGKDEYPSAIDDGDLIYYGLDTTTNSTGYDLDIYEYKFSAWGFWSDNASHSGEYVIAAIGGAGLEGVANSINSLANNMAPLMAVALMIPLIFFTWLTIKIDSDWGSPIIAFITGGLAFFLGYNAPNIVDGLYKTSAFGLALAVSLVVYSLLCIIWSWSMMFKGRWWK